MESVKKRRFTIKSFSTQSIREKISTLKNIFGLGLTISFIVSFFWHTFFFYSIHSVPSASNGLSTWAFLSISLTGLYIFSLFVLLVSYPNIIISNVSIHEKPYINFILMLFVRILPYFILYAMVGDVSVPKIALQFIVYSLFVIILFVFVRDIKKHWFSIIAYMIFGFIVCVTVAVVFSPKTSEQHTWLILITVYVLQTFHYSLKFFGKHNLQFISPIILFLGFFIFFFVFPVSIKNYNFDKLVLVAPYTIFNVGYYTGDICVNKESYNEYYAIKGTTPAKNIGGCENKIENATVLFSMGDEYIITVKDQPDNFKNEFGKKRYKRYVLKASANKFVSPSNYTYTLMKWTDEPRQTESQSTQQKIITE